MVYQELSALAYLLEEARAGVDEESMMRDVELPASTAQTYIELLKRGKFIAHDGNAKGFRLTERGVRCLWVFEELRNAYFDDDSDTNEDRHGTSEQQRRWTRQEILDRMKDIIKP